MVIEEMNVMTQHNSENRSTGSSIFSSNELTRNMPAKITNKVTGDLRLIKKLVPNQFGQTIKAKVTNKTDRNKKKSFSADIEDESGKIKIIGYGEETDNYFDLIQLNENGTQLYFPPKEVIIIDAAESVSKLDSFETNTYTQKEGYIASKNGIHIFNCHGTVIDMCTIDCPYKACFQCQKKVTKIKNDFQCPKCQKNENFVDKLRLEINIADFSWNLQKLSLFDKVVKYLLEVENTKDIRRLVLENNSEYWKIFQRVLFKTYMFEIKANKNFNNPKFKTLSTFIVTSVKKLNYKERCRQLLIEIKNMFTFWKAYVKYVNEQLTKEVSYKNLEMKFSALKL
ncbi:uncharacterized protein [Rhodnius prolixus]|uniref:uncharacterized protein n=1 Tax=Rhodnius prolixus TaxID=13249 RepID=UPI003D18FADC